MFTLFVNYEDYINNTKEEINRIELFFDLPITKVDIKPEKARYSRDNTLKIKFIKKIVYILEILQIKSFVKRMIKRQ